MRIILHIDFNSYFATVEQQANPRLRGKPIGVTGGDRTKRTVIGAASVEAKRFGVKTGMQIWEALQLCPQIILVAGDSDKYLECTKRFLNIVKDYSPYVEVFSIDEVFLELRIQNNELRILNIAKEIKSRIRSEIGEWITCSIGISYNKLMAKLAGSLIKPDGLVVIKSEEQAMEVLDSVPLDEICGIGNRINKRLNKMGIFSFKSLRAVPKKLLLLEFKSYGNFLYDAARGIDNRPLIPFYQKGEVKSIGHRLTIDHDTNSEAEIKQIMLKLTELIARRLRSKALVGKTVSFWYRNALSFPVIPSSLIKNEGSVKNNSQILRFAQNDRGYFSGGGMQTTIPYTQDGLKIFNASWKIFHQLWNKDRIRMVGVSISNLKSAEPKNLSFLDEDIRQEKIIKVLDIINNKYGEFTLKRGVLLGTTNIQRKANSFLADRRFKFDKNSNLSYNIKQNEYS